MLDEIQREQMKEALKQIGSAVYVLSCDISWVKDDKPFVERMVEQIRDNTEIVIEILEKIE